MGMIGSIAIDPGTDYQMNCHDLFIFCLATVAGVVAVIAGMIALSPLFPPATASGRPMVVDSARAILH